MHELLLLFHFFFVPPTSKFSKILGDSRRWYYDEKGNGENQIISSRALRKGGSKMNTAKNRDNAG